MNPGANGYDPLLEQAAIWIEILDAEDTPEHRLAFFHWVVQSPQHVDAFLAMRMALFRAKQVRRRRRANLSRDTAGSLRVEWVEAGFRSYKVQHPLLVWVAGLACCAGLGFWWVSAEPRVESASVTVTSPSQAQAAASRPSEYVIRDTGYSILPDGSLMRVVGPANIRVSTLSATNSVVTIFEGTAYFSGDHRTGGSLQVVLGKFNIEVLGTQFEVEDRNASAGVSVFEGAVRISSCHSSGSVAAGPGQSAPNNSSVLVKADEAIHFKADDCAPMAKPTPAEHLDLLQRDASDENWLLFPGTPVKVAVRMFNRANSGCLILVDKAAGQVKVGGRFLSTDIDGFLSALAFLGVEVANRTETANGLIIYLRPGKSKE